MGGAIDEGRGFWGSWVSFLITNKAGWGLSFFGSSPSLFGTPLSSFGLAGLLKASEELFWFGLIGVKSGSELDCRSSDKSSSVGSAISLRSGPESDDVSRARTSSKSRLGRLVGGDSGESSGLF